MRRNINLEIFVLVFLEGIILCSSHVKLQSMLPFTTNYFKRGIDNPLRDKQDRDIINSFVNAWNTRLQPDTDRSYRNLIEHKRRNHPDYRLFRHPAHDEIWNKILSRSRKRGFDNYPDINLDNVFNPQPIKRKYRPSGPIATTYVGDSVDDEDESPPHKLATLISKPIYHDISYNVRKFRGRNGDADNLRRFMYENTKSAHRIDNSGFRDEDFIGNAISEGNPRQFRPAKENGQQSTTSKRFNIVRRDNEYNNFRSRRNELLSKIFALKEELLAHQNSQKGIKQNEYSKKELISEPYYSLPGRVSESSPKSEVDRPLATYHTETNLDDFDSADDKSIPFKLEKKNLWGRIEKRWKRSGPRELEPDISRRPVVRSIFGSIGETGNSFDAYGGIGQDVSQTLVKLNPNSQETERVDPPCKQNAQQSFDPDQGPINAKKKSGRLSFDPDQSQISNIQNNDQFYFNNNQEIVRTGSQNNEDGQKENSNYGILKVDENSKKRSMLKKDNTNNQPRNRRTVLARKFNHRSHHKQSKGLKNSNGKTAESVSKKRYFDIDEVHGLPDSRPTEHEGGIFEDDEHSKLEDKLARDSTPYLMKIAQHDREDIHKLWTNKHSAGNGIYAGHGEGPNNAYLGDYFGHDPGLIEKDIGLESLENSPSMEDHRTARIIDSIWDHDSGDEHVGSHHLEGHPGGEKIQSYFGHHDVGVLLPTETLEGFDKHWSGNIPHTQVDPEEHAGHPVDLAPTRIKAIQAIQDDPSIDAAIGTAGGVGTEIEHRIPASHHGLPHDYEMRHTFNGGSQYATALVNDPVRVDDSHEEEYKQHNSGHIDESHEEEYKQHMDDLLSRYHGLEEKLRGTEGTLAEHVVGDALHHHGHNQLRTGFDFESHPWDTPAPEEPAMPPSFPPEGKGDEGGKSGPLVEGGKEEGGKGGPLVEGGKVSKEKENKEDEKNIETPKGGKENDKMPLPNVPEQRSDPEQSKGSSGNLSGNEVSKDDNGSKGTNNKKVDQDKEQNTILSTLLSSSDRQSKLVNDLQEALKSGSKHNKGIASMQLAKLVQLNTLQQALIKTLASPLSDTNEGSGTNSESESEADTDSPLEQLGKKVKPHQAMQFINALKENSNLVEKTHSHKIPVSTGVKLEQSLSSNTDRYSPPQHRQLTGVKLDQSVSSNTDRSDSPPQNHQLTTISGKHLDSFLNDFSDLSTKAFFQAKDRQKNIHDSVDSGGVLIDGKLAQIIQSQNYQQSNEKSRVKQTMRKPENSDLAYSSIGSGIVRSDLRNRNRNKREKTMTYAKER